VLQCVAVCCSVLQCVGCRVYIHTYSHRQTLSTLYPAEEVWNCRSSDMLCDILLGRADGCIRMHVASNLPGVCAWLVYLCLDSYICMTRSYEVGHADGCMRMHVAGNAPVACTRLVHAWAMCMNVSCHVWMSAAYVNESCVCWWVYAQACC